MEQVGDIDVKTTGIRPVATTAFSMLCKQQLNANGGTPGKYMEMAAMFCMRQWSNTEARKNTST